ncbi:MAG: hypothetical protein FJZ47_08105 [Candidatus Tectomicrobia bacterium]|uniref:Uncharacterized protein n=1 Tax=Tectimicrobiota bacterium TaxID=2528274 RepID=A0A937W0Z4_UNCTE|nr:hypothetical protein [Candidatus Tectomicrobia bacterium]
MQRDRVQIVSGAEHGNGLSRRHSIALKQLFREHHPDRPMFAIASTGSAAARLLESRSDVTGQAADARILRHHPSYPLVMERIFTDLGWLRPRTA